MNGQYEISSRSFEEIKNRLRMQLTNMGEPYITVDDGNFENRGELLLRHKHQGFDLDDRYTRETLRNVHRIWNRPWCWPRAKKTSPCCTPTTAANTSGKRARNSGPVRRFSGLRPWPAGV
jgi:spore cortex formation protein SpoVR/YcgB (stage V sporulation)